MNIKFSAKTQSTFNASSAKATTGGNFSISKASQRKIEFAANRAARMNTHVDNITGPNMLEEGLVADIGAFDDSVLDAANSADMLGPTGRAICTFTGLATGAMTGNSIVGKIANANCRLLGELFEQHAQEERTEGEEELEHGSSGSEAPDNTDNEGGADGDGEEEGGEGGSEAGGEENDGEEGGSEGGGESGESDDSDDESEDESDGSGNAEDDEDFVGPPAPTKDETTNTEEGEAPAGESNPNPMDENYVDPAIERKYGKRFRTYLGRGQKDLIKQLGDINPVTDPAEESAERGDYSGPTLAGIKGSLGGTSTGLWEEIGGEYLGPSLEGVQVSLGGTSTGNDWF